MVQTDVESALVYKTCLPSQGTKWVHGFMYGSTKWYSYFGSFMSSVLWKKSLRVESQSD